MSTPSPVVWVYWEDVPGRTRAPYLDICLETIQRQANGLEVRVLCRDDVGAWIPKFDKSIWEGLPAPNYRSDYARARLLLHHGGIWADIDTIAVAPLSRLLNEIDESGFVSWGREMQRCYMGVIAAVPKAAFTQAWVEAQDRVLNDVKDWSSFRYSELSQDSAAPVSYTCPWKNLAADLMAPILYDRWRQFLSPFSSPRRLLSKNPFVIVLWNAVMGPALATVTRQELLGDSPMLIARLLRIGLGVTTLEQESRDRLLWLDPISRQRYTGIGVRVESRIRRALRVSGS